MAKKHHRWSRGIVLLAAAGLTWAGLRAGTGCGEEQDPSIYDGGGGGLQGDPCTQSEDCAFALVCAGTGTCQRPGQPGTSNLGGQCTGNTDCVIDLICASDRTCVVPGKGVEGETCHGNEACARELVCSSQGECAKPGDPGTTPFNEACTEADDCAFTLACINDVCTPVPYWPGPTCATDTGPLRAYFEIPRSNKPVTEFYRLPFPNDIRLKNGRVDVSGHHLPPGELGAVVGNVVKAINQDVTGFGPNTTVFFRMSRSFDLGTIALDFVNIDAASPAYGKGVAWGMWSTTAKGQYICHNYITVRPNIGQPLLSETTYAVLLRKGITDNQGVEAVQDADFKLVLADTAPTDPEEKAAWTAYQPLRAYLKDKGIPPSDVLSAAVYTTMNPRARMARFRDAVHAETAPAPTKLALCDGTTTSPCAGTETSHVCPAKPDPAFHELQGTYKTPVFQQGTLPYKTVADGGAITYDADGKPTVNRQDTACFALSIPKGATMPAAGWPVVIFAHGTGGSYRSFIGNGTAAALAHVQEGTNTVSRMAVIGIDASMHGPRRGSGDPPEELFFNLQNPRASRDNVYQGAADKFQLLRLVVGLDLDAQSSPTGEPIKLDPDRIYFFGHSQGTIEGIPFLAFEPDVKGMVLSGAGGYLLGSLLNKTKPVNVAGLVEMALGDVHLGSSHPVLNLFQLLFEEVDSLNYGKAMFSAPETGVDPRHTFLSFGVADGYTPPSTIYALGWSMDIRQVVQEAHSCGDSVCNGPESCANCPEDCEACPAGTTCGDGTCDDPKEKKDCHICPEDCGPCPYYYGVDDPPVTENFLSQGVKVTVGLVQYVSDGTYDDHLVAFKNPLAIQQTTHFLGSAARDGAPTILEVK